MNCSNYRADIDGLRAFAVISVALFHLDISMFRGGFVGVDVFFVISGFLITRLIRDEVLEKKSFSFSNFYLRRARRILPSLFFTLSLSFVFAYMLFAPQHFERFGGSLLHAVISISNFYFWNESGYFNTVSEFKPLLHTWSLSVEEQFYMVWPLVLVFALRKTPKHTTPVILVTIGLLSLFLNQIFADGSIAVLSKFFPYIAEWFSDGPATIFFLAPFRVFEFAIGALVVWLVRFQPKNRLALEPLVLIGLGMISYSVVTFSKDIVFPSYNALLPCVGTALLIYGGTARYSGKLLTNTLAVKTGLISYSLYLIHWPLIVFYRYWKIDDLYSIDKYLLLVVSFVSAVFMYRFVEQPFRRGIFLDGWSYRGFVFTCVISGLILALPAANVWVNNGWVWRFPEKLVAQLNFKSDHYHKYVWARHNALEKGFLNNGKPRILVIGDSMAADFVNILAESSNIEKFDLVTIPVRDGCRSVFPVPEYMYEKFLSNKIDTCKEQHESIIGSNLLKQADSIVLASSWDDWNIDLIGSTVNLLKRKGVPQVAIVGRKDQSMNGVKYIAKYAFRKTSHNIRTPMHNKTEKINKKIKQVKSDFLFIDLLNCFCNDDGCQRVTDNGYLIIYDNSHLSPEGAKHIGSNATRSQWMASLESAIRTQDKKGNTFH